MGFILTFGRLLFSTLLIGGAIWTLKEEVSSFNRPMTKFFKATETQFGIPSELPLKYLESIVYAALVGLILGASQMFFNFKSGGWMTLIFFSFLALVRDFPGFAVNAKEEQLQTIMFIKDLAVIGGVLLFLGTPTK
mmetsp:Transcript_17701/g.15616  ORF Transcript_17701/g.15616 Transcript_17701/m.15616 type:complete len:136 (+) Transcript_17701:23-430(+)